MYQWLVFLHVLGVLGFLTAHGASAAITFKLRGERELSRVGALLELSRGSNMVANICLLIFLLAGIIAGFMGAWWGQGWIWLALGLLIALAVVMFALGSGPLERVRQLLEAHAALVAAPATSGAGSEATSDTRSTASIEEQVAALLDATHPALLTALGGGVVAVILWLMMFKPV
ncbi:MAG TPA: hypothetical protein VHI51_20000 [Ktedonobacterales bacterium]|nr:hypothetical protein [Ktedonobacterales bacterium]